MARVAVEMQEAEGKAGVTSEGAAVVQVEVGEEGAVEV